LEAFATVWDKKDGGAEGVRTPELLNAIPGTEQLEAGSIVWKGH
jgi:hypothetical protein